MAPDTRYARIGERCEELAALLRLRAPYQRQMFSAVLGGILGSTVRIVPLQLPVDCTSVWLGFTGIDRIGCNIDWPEHEIDLAGHAIGHLVLGHCGDARDGGQFACTTQTLGEDDRRRLGRFMHEPAEGGVSRMFSDGEERAAAMFSRALGESLGIRHPRLAASRSPGLQLACLG
jgi:hypothetical protein